MAPTKEIMKKQTRAYVDEFVRDLALEKWRINLVFDELDDTVEDMVYADSNATWQYKDATITVDLDKVRKKKEEKNLRAFIKHEMCHLMNAPMSTLVEILMGTIKNLSEQIEEHSTSELERMALWGEEK